MKITPNNITELKPCEVFVFGSNESGMHAGGAARAALAFGAKWGVPEGRQGNAYAIPTMGPNAMKPLALDVIKKYVLNFIDYAKAHPDEMFYVTEIGCGIAGFSPLEMAPLFAGAIGMPNVALPKTFLTNIDENARSARRVFLGGTCNGSGWRESLIPKLRIEYFNPVVPDWTEEVAAEELRQRETCDYCLYVITPKMTGVYSIAEVVDDSNKRPEKTLFCYVDEDGGDTFDAFQLKSLRKVSEMVSRNGGTCMTSLDEVADFLNSKRDVLRADDGRA